MSHDRGCPCGREKYEYENCPRPDCDRNGRTPRPVIEPAGCASGTCQRPEPGYTTPANDRIRIEVLTTVIGFITACQKESLKRERAQAVQEDESILQNLKVMRDHPNWYFSDGEEPTDV